MPGMTVLPLATAQHKAICAFGMGPAMLNPIPLGPPVLSSGFLVGQIQDFTPASLLPPVGSCVMCLSLANPAVAAATAAALGVLQPQVCTPIGAGPWISPATATTLINNQPAFLMAGAMRMCAFGGVITTIG